MKDDVRDARGLAWIPGTRLDFVLGVRMMKKHPALSIVGGLGMAFGIAMTVGMFVFMRANFFPTIPLDEGDRIVALENRDMAVGNEDRRVLHDFAVWRHELRSVEDIGAFRTLEPNMALANEAPEPTRMAEMSAAGFRLARVQPLMGRYLLNDDERVGSPRVAVIGAGLWRARFGGQPGVVGMTIKLGGAPHTIVGVMPEDFGFPIDHQMWIPLRADPAAFARRFGPSLYVFGRLVPGATLQSAQVELSQLGKQAAAAYPENARIEPMVMPYIHSIADIQGMQMWSFVMIQAMMSILLFVVAVNVAMLVYARTAARQGEIAVRTALGAGRARIVSQLFIEALTLALVSSVVGLGIAYVGVHFGAEIASSETAGKAFWVSYRPDTLVLLYTISFALLAAVVVGVIPALQATGKRLQVSLRALGGSAPRLGRTWTTLIVAQVALAVAALPATVNYAWTEMQGAFTRNTYDSRYFVMATLRPDAPAEGDSRTVAVRPMGERVTEIMRRLGENPAVADVSYRTSFAARRGPIEVEHVDPPPGAAGYRAASNGVAPGYFTLFGLHVFSGRGFQAADMDTASSAVIVNRAFASLVFGTTNPLGRRIRVAGQPAAGGSAAGRPASRWYEIVGVVENERTNDVQPRLSVPVIYYAVSPDRLMTGEQAVLELRLTGTAYGSAVPAMRQVVAQVDPTLRLGMVTPRSQLDRQQTNIVRLLALGLGLVLVGVFLLSAAGIYALVSHTVTHRRREIGIRSALGASQRQVLTAVLWPVARQIAFGLMIGLAGSAAIDRLSGDELLGGRGGLLLPAFGIAMSVVALLAAFGPARRGLRTQPTEALRAEA